MKRFHIIYILALLAIASCGNSGRQVTGSAEENGGADKPLGPLKIAVMPTLDCLPAYVAQELGLYDEHEVEVKLTQFKAQMDCDTALMSGSADGAFTDMVRVEHMRSRGAKLNCVAQTNMHWQLITNKMARINKLEQLENKMIAMTRFSATHLLADSAMKQGKLTDEKTFLVQINDVALRLLMLKNNEMDALLLPEPHATEARLQNNKVLMDSKEMDLRLGALAFRTADSLRNKQIEQFVAAYVQACDTIDKHGLKKYSKLIASYCGVSPSIADSIPQNVTFGGMGNLRQADVDKAENWYKNNR